jgi:hypothetical protein
MRYEALEQPDEPSAVWELDVSADAELEEEAVEEEAVEEEAVVDSAAVEVVDGLVEANSVTLPDAAVEVGAPAVVSLVLVVELDAPAVD